MATLIKASTARTRAGKVNIGDLYVGQIAESIVETAERGGYETTGYAPEEYKAYVNSALVAAGYDVLPYFRYAFGGICCGTTNEPKSIWEKFLDLFGTKEPDYVLASDLEPQVDPNHFIVSWAKAPPETQTA